MEGEVLWEHQVPVFSDASPSLGMDIEVHGDCEQAVGRVAAQVVIPGQGVLIVPGMTFTVEPMINMGGNRHCRILDDHWTVETLDRSLSAQFEHTITVTKTGVEILTLSEGQTLDLTTS